MCALDARAAWTWRVTSEDLRQALNRDPTTRVGRRLSAISVLDADPAGRSRLLALEGESSPVVRGEEFRRVVLAVFGARSLRSLRFTLAHAADEYVFAGRGSGHGAGLCQAGALARLAAGASVLDVIAYYYPGVEVRDLTSLERQQRSPDDGAWENVTVESPRRSRETRSAG